MKPALLESRLHGRRTSLNLVRTLPGAVSMKHPIPLHRRLLLLARWPFSRSARETWHALKRPANARRLLESIEQLKLGEAREHDLVE